MRWSRVNPCSSGFFHSAVILALLSFPSVLAVNRAAAGTIHSVVEFRAPDFRVEPTAQGARYSLGDCPRWNRPGAPSVPFRTVYVAIPEGESVIDVRVTAGNAVDLGPLPAPAPGMSRPGAERDAWDGRTAWPEVSFSTGETGWMRGVQLQSVILWPVRWDPAAGRARLTTSYDIEVVTGPAGPLPEGVWKPARTGTASEIDFRRRISRLVLNPAEL